MKPIFLVVCSYPRSVLAFRRELIEKISNLGYAIHVAAPDLHQGSSFRSEFEALDMKVHNLQLSRTGLNPLTDLVTLLKCWMLFKKIKPHTVFCYTVKPVVYGSIAASMANVAKTVVLITGLGYAWQNNKFSRRLLKKVLVSLYSVSLSKSSLVFFQNQDDHSAFETLGIVNNNVRTSIVNGSGVNLDHFAPVPVPEAPCFLMLGRLIKSKGVWEFAEAARRIGKKYPDVRFCLAGWIDENPDSIKEEELNSWVDQGVLNFLGDLEDVRPALAECSVYVLPSYREGTPRSVLEAMAVGRAIVTTDAPGCSDTVCEGRNGFLVTPKSVDELVHAMEKFLLNPELAGSMGSESRRIAEENYDVFDVSEKMIAEMGLE